MWAEALDHWGESIAALDKLGAVLKGMGETELLLQLVEGFRPMCLTLLLAAPLDELDAFDARRAAAKSK